MKSLYEYNLNSMAYNGLNERMSGSSFENEVKYSASDWEKWKKSTEGDTFIGNLDGDDNIELAYLNTGGNKIKHIGTYDKKKQVLWCSDISLFGHEVK